MSNPQEAMFDMVALGNVEAGGVQYGPGDPFSVQGIERARWLVERKAAVFASSVDVAPVEDGGLNPQPGSEIPAKEGTRNGNESTSQAGPGRRNR